LRGNDPSLITLGQNVRKFVQICAAQSAVASVEGVESKRELLMLRSCGAWVISGPAIGDGTSAPGPVGSLFIADA
jgi:EAL domain-containing protein (putative c-di-GMP-specific phosphodiesterase class I)